VRDQSLQARLNQRIERLASAGARTENPPGQGVDVARAGLVDAARLLGLDALGEAAAEGSGTADLPSIDMREVTDSSDDVGRFPKTARAVVIDDDRLVASAVAHLLHAHGATRVETARPDEALAAIEALDPHVVVASIRESDSDADPEMGLAGFCEARGLPLIFLSRAHTSDEALRRVRAHGHEPGRCASPADLIARVRRQARLARDRSALVGAGTLPEVHSRAVAASINGIVVADARAPDMPLIDVNPAFSDLTGYSRDESIGRNCRFLQGAETDPDAVRELADAVSAGRSCSVTLLNYRKSGEPFWNQLWLSPIADESGALAYYVGILHDVSDRIEAEQALAKSEQDLRSVLDSTREGFLVVDEDRRILFTSRRFGEITGLPPEMLEVGRSHDDLVARFQQKLAPSRDPSTYRAGIEKIYAGSERNSLELIELNDGRVLEREWRPLVRSGETAGIIWILRDVSELHRAVRRAETARERIRLGQLLADVGTWEWDVQRDRLYWSENIPPMFGLEAGERTVSYADFIAATHPDDRAAVEDAVTRAVDEHGHYQMEHRVVWPDGTVRWLGERGGVVRDEHGRVEKVVGVVIDIDERKRAQIALVEAREAAERSDRAKSEFLSRMSHELRTPMNAVLGFAQLLQFDERLPADLTDNAEEIVSAGNHLLELINEVLDLSKIEAGQVDLRIEPLPIAPVLDECCGLIEGMASRRAISVECEAPAELNVNADRIRLKQALLNLLSNAVKYNREHGSVKIAVRPEASNDVIAFHVSDTGPGIQSDQLDRLFEPFDRLDQEHAGIEGTGMGLAITRRLVEMMRGTIDVSSERGSGSTFTLRLPAAEPPAGGQTPRPPPVEPSDPSMHPEAGPKPARILYVEDDPSSRRLLSRMLERSGDVEVSAVANAQECLGRFPESAPDIVLVDLQLPGVSGLELLHSLRQLPGGDTLPVIAVSASAMPDDRDRALEEGFDAYLAKPLKMSELYDALNRWRPGHRRFGGVRN
jgi:PAS domain S-box-containing protein